MDVKVSLNNLRIAPRKSREVIDLIRGKSVADARSVLEFTVKRASYNVLKLLNSAVATALKEFKLNKSDLYVKKVTVDEGPKLKRSFPMSRGRAYPIMKRTSHITLILEERKAADETKTGEVKKAASKKKETKTK